jgi:hypothetical protein
MCERCREKAEKAIRQGTGFRVTPGEAAKLEEILCQIEELEKKKALWWEKQLSLAGFPPGEYQFLPSEGVIVRWTLEDLAEELIDDLTDEFFEQWSNPHLKLV